MKSFGAGVHHLAFEVDDVNGAFLLIKDAGVSTTSEKVTTDVLSGLKQFFILPCHAGFFIELIERPKQSIMHSHKQDSDASAPNFFTNDNMAELASSISNFVDNASLSMAEHNCSQQNEEKKDDLDVASALSDISVGHIEAVSIEVDDMAKAADFLINVLGFRMLSHSGSEIRLQLPGATPKSVDLIIAKAGSKNEQRQATMVFNTPGLTESRIMSLIESGSAGDYKKYHGINGVLLPEWTFSYKVLLAEPSKLSSLRTVVQSDPHKRKLQIHIKAEKNLIMNFLSNPANLTQWTGHKAIHFSKRKDSWIETRLGSEGQLVESHLIVSKQDSEVVFFWTDRDVRVVFYCSERASGYSMLSVTLPPIAELQLARMKRIISLELDLLKAILEDNTDTMIPDRHYQHIHAYHLSMYGMQVKKILPADAANEFGFKGEVLLSGSLVDMMKTDFALAVRSEPLAVLRPKNIDDVAAAVRMANELDVSLAARGSQVSHSAGGQAQANNGILLDMSTLSSVGFVRNGQAVKVGAGAFWDEVIRLTLSKGMMPPVINDYQYLSVGGTISMGGIGFMSHKLGVQAGYVEEIDIVTGLGDVLTRSSGELFDCARAGLGQLGIIGSVTLPLVKAPSKILIFKLFYRDIHTFIEDVKFYVNSGHIDMIHAFLKPCTSTSLGNIIGSEALLSTSSEFQSTIKAGESEEGLLFFLELGSYIMSEEATFDSVSNEVSSFLSSNTQCIGNEIFSEIQNFHDYITKDPPVVETNKAHGKVPHPSFATTIDESNVVQLLEHHIKSPNRGDDNVNEILLMPVKSNAYLGQGSSVPMLPLPEGSNLSFFLLFLGSVVANHGNEASEAEIMESIRAHHRSLYKLSNDLGGKRYSYDTITSEIIGEEAWRKHYGDVVWERLCAAKRQYDPHHILCPGIKMWD